MSNQKQVSKKVQKQIDQRRKELENNPAYKYMSSDEFEFPKLFREDMLAEYGDVNNTMKKIEIETYIIEEQRKLQDEMRAELDSGEITSKTPDGKRLMNTSDVLAQIRMCESQIWQSKITIEKKLHELTKFVGISIPLKEEDYLLTPKEHNEFAMYIVNRLLASNVKLFKAGKTDILEGMKRTA